MSSPTFSVNDVASFLGMSLKWVYAHQKEIPGRFKIGGAVFFDRDTFYAGIKDLAAGKPERKARTSPVDRHGLT